MGFLEQLKLSVDKYPLYVVTTPTFSQLPLTIVTQKVFRTHTHNHRHHIYIYNIHTQLFK